MAAQHVLKWFDKNNVKALSGFGCDCNSRIIFVISDEYGLNYILKKDHGHVNCKPIDLGLEFSLSQHNK